MARYERLGLFSPLGTPKKQTLAELASEMAGEAPKASSEQAAVEEEDDDDDFTTEDALEASQRKLDELLRRAEVERARQKPSASDSNSD